MSQVYAVGFAHAIIGSGEQFHDATLVHFLGVQTFPRSQIHGFCCVQYQVCDTYDGIALSDHLAAGADPDGFNDGTWNEGWTIDLDLTPWEESATGYIMSDCGLVDAGCSGDYVEIPCNAK